MSEPLIERESSSALRRRVHTIIFEAHTPAGKLFDVLLIMCILASVVTVMLDSVASFQSTHRPLLRGLEWFFTILFTIEYLLRLWCVGKPLRYAKSFFGIVDLLAILPTYISLLIAGSHYLAAVRILRVLRVFRVFKLATYVDESRRLMTALRSSMRKIAVFLFVVLTLVVVLGSLMYVIESGHNSGFSSIPRSIYWAIVTLTTVGYGDISPQTGIGQALAAVIMILGYSIIVVPTGFIAVEAARDIRPVSTEACPSCSAEGHDPDAQYCKYCGASLR